MKIRTNFQNGQFMIEYSPRFSAMGTRYFATPSFPDAAGWYVSLFKQTARRTRRSWPDIAFATAADAEAYMDLIFSRMR